MDLENWGLRLKFCLLYIYNTGLIYALTHMIPETICPLYLKSGSICSYKPRFWLLSELALGIHHIHLHAKIESGQSNTLEVMELQKWFLCQKGHPDLCSKASLDRENRGLRLELFMLIEDIYMHLGIWSLIPSAPLYLRSGPICS